MVGGTGTGDSDGTLNIPAIFREALGSIVGGRVLDVATGVGNFVNFLRSGLASYETITGIDVQESAIDRARAAFPEDSVDFRVMDAMQMDFLSGSFDTVSIMASLHHVADLDSVLGEIQRVLRPAGTLIVAEMHADAASAASETGVMFHQWAAAIDEACGDVHRPTMARSKLTALIRSWNWERLRLYEWAEPDVPTLDDGALDRLDAVISHYARRARSCNADPSLQETDKILRRRIREVGLGQQPFVIAVGMLAN